ncbi:hypothetical protein BS47DRAFT_1338558 [Hydnum rufescens UP504]|uniref:Uncharacterized protein n=1 Tax=Hydnum rufescens UP504 TaxID=1448309 RepID=A0A9P6B5U7_9AGAM|nr:hypothetical protein BS47DRAFT_1338558 [Hydnum rufescens UP504]
MPAPVACPNCLWLLGRRWAQGSNFRAAGHALSMPICLEALSQGVSRAHCSPLCWLYRSGHSRCCGYCLWPRRGLGHLTLVFRGVALPTAWHAFIRRSELASIGGSTLGTHAQHLTCEIPNFGRIASEACWIEMGSH